MQADSIIRYTEQIAGEIASRYAATPLAELELWLRLAHQREAMVSQLYELSEFDSHLVDVQDGGLRALIHSVVHGIWSHERSHTEFLSSVREGSGAHAALAQLQGQVEGWVTQGATRGSSLARLVIAVGAALGQVPDFARELRSMQLLELLAFNAELEATARMGYQRILQVADQVDPAQASAYGFSFRYDVACILGQENFHQAVFVEMQRWLQAGGHAAPALSVDSCTRALHRLCEQNLSVGAVRAVAAEHAGVEAHVPGDTPSSHWVSDGGLGSVFRAARLDVPVAGTP